MLYYTVFATNTYDCAVSRGHQELQVVSTAIQTVLSTPVSVATALKGIQKNLGKALPFKVRKVKIQLKKKKVKLDYVFLCIFIYICLLHKPSHLPQLESVGKCASRLQLLSKALDVSDLRLDGNTGPWRNDLLRLQGAALKLDIKESLLEAWGLVLLANNQLDPQKSGELVLQKDLSTPERDEVRLLFQHEMSQQMLYLLYFTYKQ